MKTWRASARAAAACLCLSFLVSCQTQNPTPDPEPGAPRAREEQVTRGPGGRILTNTGVWSPDSEWIVYDCRPDPAGERFEGTTIEAVHVRTSEIRELYRAKNGAHCGVATFHPTRRAVVFILGPEFPTPDWQYGPYHRQGVVVDWDQPGLARNLEARDLTEPFTPGALRGGTHVHVWHPAGDWVSFTYEDHVLAQFRTATASNDVNQRQVGVWVPNPPVKVDRDHPRNHDGTGFAVVVTQTQAAPTPGSDEIARAFEEGWIGTNGYVRPDGTRQRRALAFQGQVAGRSGEPFAEVFVVDLPEDLTRPGRGPLAGTAARAPAPPAGVSQRRVTFTETRRFPGIQGPRHWLRSSPDGSRIATLMKDDSGIVQIWTVSPNGGPPRQLTRNPWPVASAFSWSPDGRYLAHVMDNSVCLSDAATGATRRLTPRSADALAPRPEACVFSPDGKKIAFVRRRGTGPDAANQICVLFLEP